MTALPTAGHGVRVSIEQEVPIGAPDGVSRRIFLKGLGAIGVSLALPSAAIAAAGNDQTHQNFTTVSRFLTQSPSLPEDLSRALMIAFGRYDDHFDDKLAKLRDYIDRHRLTAGRPLLLKGVTEAEAFAELPQQILSAWYLGVVGSGEGAICVTYVNALAYQTTADKLRPPSYAYGAYGSWASKPV